MLNDDFVDSVEPVHACYIFEITLHLRDTDLHANCWPGGRRSNFN